MDRIEDNAPARYLAAREKSANEGFSVIDGAQVIADNLRLLLFVPIALGVIALTISFFIPPTYTATVKFLPPQQQMGASSTMLQSLGALGTLAGAASGLKNPTDQYVAFLKTRTVQDALVDKFMLQTRYGTKFKKDARDRLGKNTKIEAGKENIITVDFEDREASVSAEIANAYVSALGTMLSGMAITEAQQRRQFFDKQLATTKNNLIFAEQALAASGVSISTLNTTPATALEGPARLRAQVTAQEVKLASMRSYLTEAAPEYRQAAAELGALRAQLRKAEQQQPASAGNGNDYIARYREFKYQETLFELFAKQLEIAKVDESREGATIQVLDVAVPPEVKSGPKKALIAIGTTLGSAFILFVWIFLRHAFRVEESDGLTSAKLRRLKASIRKAFGLA